MNQSIVSPDLYSPVHRVTNAERAHSFLRRAFSLWDKGGEVAAGMMARAAIEWHLRHLFLTDARVTKRHSTKNMDRCIWGLLTSGVIDAVTWRALMRVLGDASAAAHGRASSYARLASILQCARVILSVIPQEEVAP